jgi:uncharacterized protein YndB with AHSA1/START domain
MTSTPRSSQRRFDFELEIQAAPDAVWDAISTGAGLRRWFPPEAEVTPGKGGSVRWRWGEFHDWPQTIEVWEPGKRLLTRYDSSVPDGKGGKHQLGIDWTLEARGGSTRLRLVQSGFGPEASFDQEYDGISRGWPVELGSLRLSLERHAGQERELAWVSYPVASSAAEAWRRVTGPEGLGCGPEAEGWKPGAPMDFRTSDGDRFVGEVLLTNPSELTARVSNLGDAFLRISVEEHGGGTHVWLWLATYGRAADETRALQGRWEAMMQRMFQGSARGARAQGISS